MIYVIAITGIVSLLIGVMMMQYLMHTYSIRSSIRKTQDFYTAEAGIKKGFYYLTNDMEKGIEWRTGNYFNDEPLIEKVFYGLDHEVELSVLDDCGYLRIKSQTVNRPGKRIEVVAAGILPANLKNNLLVVAKKPLVLNAGARIEGMIKLNYEPIFRGGGIDGILETNSTLSVTPVLNKTFANAIQYFKYLLSTPIFFSAELYAPQVFSPDNTINSSRLFVNDAVLIENNNFDSLWFAGDNIIIASTADVQISGSTAMSNITVLAIGTVKLLDNANIKSSKVYSESSIEIADQAQFSGVLIAPEVRIIEKTKISEPTAIYSGPPFSHGAIVFDNELPSFCNAINLCTDKDSKIEISEQSQIEGFIYSRALVTHHGEIRGFLFCNGFYEKPITQDTMNTNIISGIIKPTESTKDMLIPIIFQKIEDFSVLEWQEF